jgi:hypothetical protein
LQIPGHASLSPCIDGVEALVAIGGGIEFRSEARVGSANRIRHLSHLSGFARRVPNESHVGARTRNSANHGPDCGRQAAFVLTRPGQDCRVLQSCSDAVHSSLLVSDGPLACLGQHIRVNPRYFDDEVYELLIFTEMLIGRMLGE